MLIAGRPEDELNEPPEHLSRDAKVFWRSKVRRLVEVGMLDLVDDAALEMLATQYARWRAAGRIVAVEGVMTTGSHDQPMTHPAVRVERDAHRLYISLAEQFERRRWPAPGWDSPNCIAAAWATRWIGRSALPR